MDPASAKRSGIFTRLSEEDLQKLLACGGVVTFHKGQEILRQGQQNAALFVVQRGTLHAHRQAKGHRLFLGRLEPGSLFGEISLFDPGVTTATVSAATDGSLIEIRRDHLEQFATVCPGGAVQLMSGLVSQMARRMRETDERLVDSIVWGGLLK
jgi:CRP-like cAMP-binding protein